GSAHACLDGGRDPIEEPLVQRAIRLPARAETADGGARAAWPVAERDDERHWPREPERLDRRRLAADEPEARPEHGGRGIDAGGMPMEDRLEPAAVRDLLGGRESAPRRTREGAENGDRERR